MAQMEVAQRQRAVVGWQALSRWLAARALAWEDWLTFGLALFTLFAVARAAEGAGWTERMPPLLLIGFLGLLAGMLLVRAPLFWPLSWLLAAILGAAVTFWQALGIVDAGSLGEGIDQLYFRFKTWFEIAFSGGISNDSLPLVTLVIGLTWAGSFFSAWSIFRWHNAWLGLVPGAVTLSITFFLLEGTALGLMFMFAFGALLLIMRANLLARLRQWRNEGVDFPPFISLSFAHLTAWAAVFLLLLAWVIPTGGASPLVGLLEQVTQPFERLALQIARLSGPVRIKKVVPLHDYTTLLPFRGSIELRDLELLSVRVDPPPQGLILLRGASYDVYSPGGWEAGKRDEIDLPAVDGRSLTTPEQGQAGGQLVEATVQVSATAAVGTVLFTPGQPLAVSVDAKASVKPDQVYTIRLDAGQQHGIAELALLERELEEAILSRPDAGASLSDAFVLGDLLSEAGGGRFVGLAVEREGAGAIKAVQVARAEGLASLTSLRPRQNLKEGDSYVVTALVSDASPEALRRASTDYPLLVRDHYLQLPNQLPQRVRELAARLTADQANPYDKAEAIEGYLRQFPIDYSILDTPPGRDAVDYFLFEAQRGYFDYHASAMVVMLRAVGVPARLAVGFALDQRNFDPNQGAYRVADQNAYAWPEVYFPGYGWLEFNPTADRSGDLRPGEALGGSLFPSLEFLELLDLPVGDDIPTSQEAADSEVSASSEGAGGGLPIALWAFLGVALLLLVSAVSFRLGWQRAYAGLPYPQQVWEKTLRLAAWAGVRHRPSETPREYARRLGQRFYDVKGIDHMAEAYNRSRFGHREAAAAEQEALQETWLRLRYRLAKEVLGRLWRRS